MANINTITHALKKEAFDENAIDRIVIPSDKVRVAILILMMVVSVVTLFFVWYSTDASHISLRCGGLSIGYALLILIYWRKLFFGGYELVIDDNGIMNNVNTDTSTGDKYDYNLISWNDITDIKIVKVKDGINLRRLGIYLRDWPSPFNTWGELTSEQPEFILKKSDKPIIIGYWFLKCRGTELVQILEDELAKRKPRLQAKNAILAKKMKNADIPPSEIWSETRILPDNIADN